MVRGVTLLELGYHGLVLRDALYRPRDQREARDHTLSSRLVLAGVAAFLVAVPFTLLLVLVLSKWAPLARLDADTAEDLTRLVAGHSWLLHSLDVAATVFDPWVFRGLVLAVVVWLWFRGARRLALWALATTALGSVLGGVLKSVVARARPHLEQPVAHAGGYSFPSGHALNSMLGVGVLILVFLPVLRRAGRVLVYTLGALVVLLTGFDRIALGVHYVSDVLAGWVVALACIAATSAAFEIWRRERGRAPSSLSEGVDPEAAGSLEGDQSDPETRVRP
jgi:undecaprenyl-diphosphatase